MNSTPERPSTTAATVVEGHQGLIAVLVGALVVRVSGLTEWWLNPDEGIYYSILTRDTFAGFWHEVAINAHPPLYYMLLRGMGIFTWDFLWFRTFTLACGLAAVWGMWAVARQLAGPGTRGTVAGLTAGLMLAFAPGAIELSQVIRPYMMQVALLAGALFFLLRYIERSHGSTDYSIRDLGAYVTLVLLALLTHYSSVLALAAFGLITLQDGVAQGTRRGAWRKLFAVHAIPGVLFAVVYLVHLRPIMSSELAAEALDGWLRPYMITSPGEAWLAFLGFQRLLAQPWLRGLTAVLCAAAFVVSALGPRAERPSVAADRRPGPQHERRPVDARRPAVVLAAGFVVALAVAWLEVYPLGSTRHSAWLLVFVVPSIAWVVAYALSRRGGHARAWGAAFVVLLALSGPVYDALGGERAPWAPTERVLRQANLTQMIDLLDPQGTPELVVMSAQTFYLLLPLYPAERERAVRSDDGTLFHFAFGDRRVLVSEAWDFAAGADPSAPRHLAGTLQQASRAFPELGLAQFDQAALFVGGWRPPLVDQLTAASAREPFIVSQRSVPGLYAFLLDLPGLMRTFAGGSGG
ncbi:MAG: glycosyltransferase family 39 protein [Gemmatimonadota bacterium]